MNSQNDKAWDEFGVEWRAIDPDLGAIHERIEGQVRRQSAWIAVGLWLLGLMSVLGIVAGSATIWTGWQTSTSNFVVRGVAILAVSMLLAASVRALLLVRAASQTATLAQLLDLSMRRARGYVTLSGMGLWACGIAAVLGLVGTMIRTRLSGPPLMSPAIDLALLGLIAVALYLCRRVADTRRRDYDQLLRALVER